MSWVERSRAENILGLGGKRTGHWERKGGQHLPDPTPSFTGYPTLFPSLEKHQQDGWHGSKDPHRSVVLKLNILPPGCSITHTLLNHWMQHLGIELGLRVDFCGSCH